MRIRDRRKIAPFKAISMDVAITNLNVPTSTLSMRALFTVDDDDNRRLLLDDHFCY